MPNRIPYSPWADVAQFGQNLGGGIGALALQIPAFRLQQQQAASRAALDVAHRNYYTQKTQAEQQTLPEEIAHIRARTGAETELGRTRGAEAEVYKGREADRVAREQADFRAGMLAGNIYRAETEGQPEKAQGLWEQYYQVLPLTSPEFQRENQKTLIAGIATHKGGLGKNVEFAQALATGSNYPWSPAQRTTPLGPEQRLVSAQTGRTVAPQAMVSLGPGETVQPLGQQSARRFSMPTPSMPGAPGMPNMEFEVPGGLPEPFVSPVQQQLGTGPSQVPLVTSDLQMHGFTPEQAMAIKLGALRTLGHTNLPGMQSGQQPLYARNPQTGQRIMSLDGGQTWQQAQ